MSRLMRAAVRRMYGNEKRCRGTLQQAWYTFRRGLQELKRRFDTNPAFRSALVTTSIVALFILILGVIMSYNRFAQLITRVQERRAEMGKELRRRENLIPNLAAVVRHYTVHEAESFRHVSDAREKLVRADGIPEKLKSLQSAKGPLSDLFALFEQYPQLKATQSAQDLIKELSLTENRIAAAKSAYNESARKYNQLTSMFPGNILCHLYGYPALLAYAGVDEESLVLPEVGSFEKRSG